VVINPDKVEGIPYLRKMSMQLSSKMRFVSAQILELFRNDLGIRSAKHANRMAQSLRAHLDELISSGEISGLAFSQETQANAVFAVLDNAAADKICEQVRFYDWDRARGEVRWMCSFDTTEEDINRFVSLIKSVLT